MRGDLSWRAALVAVTVMFSGAPAMAALELTACDGVATQSLALDDSACVRGTLTVLDDGEVVPDADVWIVPNQLWPGGALADVADGPMQAVGDAFDELVVWSPPLGPDGGYDIVLDVDEDGIFTDGIDEVCGAGEEACFEVAGICDAVSRPLMATVDEAMRVYVARWNEVTGGFVDAHALRVKTYARARAVTLGDFDGDGDPDVVVGESVSNVETLHRFDNDGCGDFLYGGVVGQFAEPGNYAHDLTAADFDLDGHLDVFASGNSASAALFFGDGRGGFPRVVELSLPTAGRGTDAADFNGDGAMDVVRGTYNSGVVHVLPGIGDGTFGDPVVMGDAGDDPYGVTAGDVDGDGFVDVLTNAGSTGDVRLWRGGGDLTFAAPEVVPELDLNRHGSFDLYDYSGDGALDFVATNYNGRRYYWATGNGDGTFGALAEIGITPSNALGVSALPTGPPPGSPRARIAPPRRTVSVGEAFQFDGAGSEGAASYGWSGACGDAGGEGPPATLDCQLDVEGVYSVRLTVTGDDGRRHIAPAAVTVVGTAPVIDAAPLIVDEAAADGGRFAVTLDATARATDDGAITAARWLVNPHDVAFDDPLDDWWLSGVGWSVVDGGLAQTDAATNPAIALLDYPVDGPVRVEAEVTIDGGSNEAGIVVGAPHFWAGYAVVLLPATDQLRLYRRAAGANTTLATVGLGVAAELGVAYRLAVEHDGSWLRGWFEDRLVFEVYDATFGPGRVGLWTGRTPARFDALRVEPFWEGLQVEIGLEAGQRSVTLVATDGVGQTGVGEFQVECVAGEPPVAAPGGPYAIDEISGAADGGNFTVSLDGTASSDDSAIDGAGLRYLWDFGPEDFGVETLPDGRWIHPGIAVPDAGGMLVTAGSSAWGVNTVISRASYARSEGTSLVATVTTDRAMVGWKNTSDSGHYGQLVYGIYIDRGWASIYENGGNRGRTISMVRNVPYDVGIRLKAGQGARYYLRQTGDVDWMLIYDSNHSADARLRVGFDLNNGTLRVENLRTVLAGPTPEVTLHRVGSHLGTLTVEDAAGQSDTVPVEVTTAPSDPPVAAAGDDVLLGEADAVLGVWTLDIDASASSDDHGIFRYEWDTAYNLETGFVPRVVGDVSTGLRFETPGVYPVALRVTDHALQTDLDVITVTVEQAAPPVADAGGPYAVDEFSGDAFHNGFAVAFDGTASTDDATDLVYVWTFPREVFAGTEIEIGKWASSGAAQADGVSITGSNTWAKNYLFSRDAVARETGLVFEATVSSPATPRFMIGLKIDDENPHENTYPYCFYFDQRTVRVYERGSSRSVSSFTFDSGQAYDVRIEVKPGQGARYFYRANGEPDWISVYDSNYAAAGPFRRGIDVYSGTVTVHSMLETAAGPRPTYRLYGVGEHEVSLTVYDQAGQSDADTTMVTIAANEPPTAVAGPDQLAGEADASRGEWRRQFDAGASADDHAMWRYEWDFDFDGEFVADATEPVVEHAWDAPGIYAVALRVTDHANQTVLDTLVVDLRTGAPPVADAGPDLATEGVWPTSFDGTRSTDDVAVELFEWDFGDGTTGVGPRPQHIFPQPGVYEVTLRVYDRVGQMGEDTVMVTVGAGEGPSADAGGPYVAAAGGPPAHFDAGGSADDTGVVRYYWDFDALVDTDGDGDPANDLDGIGRRPQSVYAEEGTYTATLIVEDGAGQVAVDTATVEIVANLAPEVVTVPWLPGDPLSRHVVVDGRPTRLKAIARDAGALTYQWDFGDGSPPEPAVPAAVADPYEIEATHTYPPSAAGTPYTATLRVWDADGQLGEDRYAIEIRADDVDARTDVAIDEALWWLHKNQVRPAGHWPQASGYVSATTASALQAFLINGHVEEGDAREDPYVETVRTGLDALFVSLRTFVPTVQAAGDPDSNGNGLAVHPKSAQPIYQLGQVMDALASTGRPLGFARTGDEGIRLRTYRELVADMVDAYAWGQVDSGSARGGWRYSWNSGSDNSTCQWAAIGMHAAEDTFGINVPDFVKPENVIWLAESYDGVGYGYSGAGNTKAATPSGMVQLAFDDIPTTDPRWRTAEDEIARRWLWQGDFTYALFALVKALRLAFPAPVTRLSLTGLDWYDDPEVGVRRRLVDTQVSSGANWGSWAMGPQGDRNLQAAWGAIMLTPTLFVLPPVADAGDDIVWAYDAPLEFGAGHSFHRDPARELVLYEWDFDGDGSFDLVTDDPDDPRAVYTYLDPDPETDGDVPQTYVVRLRVTDDGFPPQSDVDTRRVVAAEPPHAPFAHAGGPYDATAGLTVRLDASDSFDIDPTDRVVVYEWDLDDNGQFFEDVDLVTDNPVAEWLFEGAGTYQIALRVTDAGAFNPLGCIVDVDCEPMVSLPDFTSMRVVPNLPPIADLVGPDDGTEGAVLTLDASGSVDPNGNSLVMTWDLDDDGVFDDGEGPQIEFTADDDGVYPVAVQVSDSLLIDTATFDVTVANVAPVVELGADAAIAGGAVFGRDGAFDDPGADTHEAIVDYGDGAEALALDGTSFRVERGWPRRGVYPITVAVTDDDGGAGEATVLVTVANRAPVLSLGAPVVIDEGAGFERLAGFADADADAWTATVDYGAGARALALAPDQTFALAYTWPDDAIVEIEVEIGDGADSVIGHLAVEVRNVAPVVDAGGDAEITHAQRFERVVNVADPGADTFSGEVDWADGGEPEPFDSAQPIAHVWTEPGVYEVVVRVADDDGGEGEARFAVTVIDVPPALTLPGAAQIDEGAPYEGSFTFEDADSDAWTLSVDWGDGGELEALDGAPGAAIPLAHTYVDDGSFTVTVTVADAHEQSSGEIAIEVANVAPTIDAGDDAELAHGREFERTVSIADPGADDVTATIDWGDEGEPEIHALADGREVTLTHSWPVPGVYTVRITAEDDDGGTGEAQFDVTVTNEAPVLTLPEDLEISEGAPTSFTFGFEDADSAEWTVEIDWDDGVVASPEPIAGEPFELGHTWADDGVYRVRVRVADEHETTEADFEVTVRNVAPVVEAGADESRAHGELFERTISIVDPGADGLTATIDWADGGPPEAFDLGEGRAFDVSHAWPNPGVYTVVITAEDDDGGTGEAQIDVTVTNEAPALTLPADQEVPEGAQVLLAFGFEDADSAAWTVEIDWNDGTVDTPDAIAGEPLELGHTWSDDGVYRVRVRVADEHDVTESEFEVMVLNVAPVVQAGGDAARTHGELFERTIAVIDPGADGLTAIVDWADGEFPEAFQLGDGRAFDVSHVWPDPGVYTVRVTVEDDDGGVGQAEFDVTVTNQAPRLTLPADRVGTEGAEAVFSFGFEDPDSAAWTVEIDWGDGTFDTPEAIAGAPFELGHTWVDDGVYRVALRITDEHGTAEGDFEVTALNVAPVVEAGGDAARVHGEPFERAIAVIDPGADSLIATVDWADGGPPDVFDLGDGRAFDVSHVWPDPGVYTVVITAADDDDVGEARFDVTVTDGPPAIEVAGAIEGEEGRPIALVFGFADPDSAAWDIEVAWGDGDVRSLQGAPGDAIELDHTYSQDGAYTVVITVADDHDADVAEVPAQIANVAPTVEAGGDAAVVTGELFVREARFTDPGADVWTPFVDWGDGGEPEAVAAGDDGALPLAHTWAIPGIFEVVLTVQDDDAAGEARFTVEVTADDPCHFDEIPPVADAGFDQIICGESAVLDSAGSTDNCGPLRSTWTEVIGAETTPIGEGEQIEWDAAPGRHLVTLTVCDGADLCANDDVVIEVIGGVGEPCAIGEGPCRAEGVSICGRAGHLECDAAPPEGCEGPLVVLSEPPSSIIEGTPLPVSARLRDPDGVASARLWHRIEPHGSWQQRPMTDSGDDVFTTAIPGGDVQTDAVEYFVEAEDALGVVRRAPEPPIRVPVMPAEVPDLTPPTIAHVPPDEVTTGEPIAIEVVATDASGVASVRIHYRAFDDDPWSIIDLAPSEDFRWTGELPADATEGDAASYWIEATDEAEAANTGTHPPDAPDATFHGIPVVEFTPDAGEPDAGEPDAEINDAQLPDADFIDAGEPDAGEPDAGEPDAGEPDAGEPDAEPADAHFMLDGGEGFGDISFADDDGGNGGGGGQNNGEDAACNCRLGRDSRGAGLWCLAAILVLGLRRRRRH